MKNKIIFGILAMLLVAVFAPAAMAKSDNSAKPEDSGKPDAAVEDGGTIADDKGGKPADKGGEDNGKPETNDTDKGNQGGLISAVTKARQEQFRLTKESLQQMGYHGSVSDFATQFNQAMNRLKEQVRNRLENDTNFTRDVVRNMMVRELTQIREQLMGNITVDDNELPDEMGNFTANETGIDAEPIAERIRTELGSMSPEFKKKLALTARLGTPEERLRLATQLRNRVENVPPVEVPGDTEQIRERLEQGEMIVPVEPMPEIAL